LRNVGQIVSETAEVFDEAHFM